jgi:translation initiation factor 4E
MWEDEQCKDGGRFVLRLPKSHTNKYWEDLVLHMIGEQFSVANELLGIQLSLRPHEDTISIWTKNAQEKSKVEKLQTEVQALLPVEEGMKFKYEVFSEVANQEKEPKEEREHKQWSREEGGFQRGGRGGRGGRGRGRGQ